MNFNFTMMVRVCGDVSVDQMTEALRKIQARHPALIPTAAGGAFPLSTRTNCGDNDWIEVAQAELNEPFPNLPPALARFTMLRHASGFDLVATFDHFTCDGMSGLFVLRDLLQALGDPDAAQEAIPAPPPIEDLIPQTVLANRTLQLKLALAMSILRGRVRLEKIRRRFSPEKSGNAALMQQLSAGDLSPEKQFVILPARLTTAQTADLVARCKAERTSVHAAVCVAWLRALADEMQGAKLVGRVSSPVNLREHLLEPVGDTSGLFISTVTTRVSWAPDRDFWDAAREFAQKLSRDSRDDDALFLEPLLLRRISTQVSLTDYELMMWLLFRDPVGYDFSITNLGRVIIPEHDGSLQVETFYGPLVNFSPDERTVGISTLAGQMSIAFIFRKSMMEPARGQKLLERAISYLRAL